MILLPTFAWTSIVFAYSSLLLPLSSSSSEWKHLEAEKKKAEKMKISNLGHAPDRTFNNFRASRSRDPQILCRFGMSHGRF